ncbi:MAG TPA: zinc-dependent metalloprotease [Thermomicrobiaceae bacterium]|nr:zinc-dependent metalloprotease [Thermomicrobiaceae bacterium]
MARLLYTDKRLLSVGLLVGAAVGVWAGNRAREFTQRQPATPSLINWGQARGIAANMNRETTLDAGARRQFDAVYRSLVERAVPLVASYTGDELPSALSRVYAFDRVDWVDANVESFAEMFRPLEALNPLQDSGAPRVVTVLWGSLNQSVLSAELGFLLGYLARRVLGQYDLAVLGREPVEGGKLYFVQPNIAGVERALRLPADDFRLWLTLHEVTHAFEFEAHPWLRAHVNGLLETYFSFLSQDIEHLRRGVEGLKVFWDRARSREAGNGSWLEVVMTPEQRRLFNQMQATMSVVEGYSNHVMNAVGKQLIPTYDVISKRFERRQQQRTPAEHLFARLTGLDIKMEQYRQGQAFVDYVAEHRGHDFVRRVWTGPEWLPTIEEIRDPERWIARVATL